MSRLVNDYDFDHDPRTEFCGEIIRIFDYKTDSAVFAAHVQGSAKKWALGCVNPASWFPPVAGREFTQPRAHLALWVMAQLCMMFDVIDSAQVVDTGLQPQEEWQPVPNETPVFRNVPVANPADLVALKEERPPLPPINRPVTPPVQIQGGPTEFYIGNQAF